MKPLGFSTSPNLVLRLPMWRSRLMLFLLFFAFMMLLLRALWIQGPGNAFYEAKAIKGTQRELELSASRGKILDRNGQVIATSLEAKSIIAYNDAVPDDLAPVKIRQLAQLLQISESELRKKLRDERTQIFLKRQVEPQVAQAIKQLEIPGIAINTVYRRYYPEGEAMAHVVGFTNVEDRGQEGMELSYQNDLAGHSGKRKVVVDRLGRVVEEMAILQLPQNGKDLQLSIDSKIQYLAYNAVKNAVEQHHAKAGGAVVIDVQTGEILALANWPSYNPNDRRHLSGEQLRNRVLTDTFEPGSTMKPFTVSAALEKGIVQPSTSMAIGAKFLVGPKPITDTHPYGVLTVSQIIQKSSNIGTAKIALQMPPKDMWDLYTAVGFGQAPKIGFPGAVGGTLHPYQKWVPTDQARIAFGYGISTSLFQLARAYSVFARDGELIPLTIERSLGLKTGPRVMSAKTAIEMRDMLELVTEQGGTATKARAEGYRVGGKTGTSHKLSGKGYSANQYRAYFVGLAPLSAPRIVVAVMIDEPTRGSHYGGDVAAPVFSAIVGETLRTLHVVPDSTVKQMALKDFQIIDQATPTISAQKVVMKQ
ncbi:MAG: penicillin-binding protein 2 [Burkholderiales bacterium]|nr:penicillin-binding protein 2 [Burkholderiales bacterium]